jgi:hypothetical protein
VHLAEHPEHAAAIAADRGRGYKVFEVNPNVSNPLSLLPGNMGRDLYHDMLSTALSDNPQLRQAVMERADRFAPSGQNLAKFLAADPEWEPSRGFTYIDRLPRRSITMGINLSTPELLKMQERLQGLGYDSAYYRDFMGTDELAGRNDLNSLAVFDPKDLK